MTTIDKTELARQIALVHKEINADFWQNAATRSLVLQGVQKLATQLADRLNEPENEVITGMEIIGQMSRDQMVRELIQYQVEQLNELTDNKLKMLVIQMRSARYQNRLVQEADLEQHGPMGFLFGNGGE